MPAFRKTADTFTSGAKTLPQPYLMSQEVYATEQERIFSAQWLCAGHQSQLAKAGDYFLQEVAGESLILLREQKGAAARPARGQWGTSKAKIITGFSITPFFQTCS